MPKYIHCDICKTGESSGNVCRCPDMSESSLNDWLCNLIAEWEMEGSYLDNEHDTSYDRGIGQTYKKCAKELKKVIGA